jgi:hypothetical protein
MKPDDTTFKILLIASEIIIPAIAFIGAYYFFKPVFEKEKQEKEAKKDEQPSAEDSENKKG